MLAPPALLLARLHVQQLIANSRWSDAADVGARVLRLAERSPNLEPSARAEQIRLACLLAHLGMVSGVDIDRTLLPLLRSPGLEKPVLEQAVDAIKPVSYTHLTLPTILLV